MLRSSDSHTLNGFRENPRPEWFYQPPMGAGGSGGLEGTLSSLDGAVGQVLVVVAPCNQRGLIGQTVAVTDHSGCVFDQPFAELDGVWVWSSKKYTVADGCHWSADSRCCVPADVV